MAGGAAAVAATLLESSIALTVAATAAALWCACARRSRARTRYLVWLTALSMGAAAPLLVTMRSIAVGGESASDAGAGLTFHAGPAVDIAIIVWSAVTLAMLARLAGQHVALHRWARALPPLELDHERSPVNDAGTMTRRARGVSVVRGEAGAMPVCWGILRPTIMLPADSAGWSDDLRRTVLRHECAHIQQHDALSTLIARIAIALLWFHPATWLLAARIRIERERACDERVIDSGVDPLVYGRHLLTLAREVRRVPAVAAPVARRGQLEERIAALLVADAPPPVRVDVGALRALSAFLFVTLSAGVLTPSVDSGSSVVSISQRAPSSSALPGNHPASFRTSLFGDRR